MKYMQNSEFLSLDEEVELLKSNNFHIFQFYPSKDKYKKLLKEHILNGDIIQEKIKNGRTKTIYYYGKGANIKDTITIGSLSHKALNIILDYYNLPKTSSLKNSKFGDFEITYDKSIRDNPIENYSDDKKEALAKILLEDMTKLPKLNPWLFSYKGVSNIIYEQIPTWDGEIKPEKYDGDNSTDSLNDLVFDIYKCMTYHNLLKNYPNSNSFEGWVRNLKQNQEKQNIS